MKELDLSDSYISMGLGLLVVLIVGVLLFNYFSSRSEPTITEEAEQTGNETAQVDLPTTHLVTAGETLWSISEKYFQSGYNWQDIATANNLNGQESLEVGQQLTIPNVTPVLVAENQLSPTTVPTAVEQPTNTPQPTMVIEEPTDVPQQISPTPSIPIGGTTNAKTYTVVHGDSLWKIAQAQYNDGYRWVEIAQVNNLANPDIIHSGNVLTLP